ncbi:hypothetical protein PEX1_076860 [Penicillium expansum]|nr:hypothetical protein PEX1_076860 [Penicillium expansum]
MPSYKDNPPDQEYLDSIKKHTDKDTNKVNLGLVAKDFGYTTAKSFYKKYAKLKKAHNLTNGHIYGDTKLESSPIKAAPTKASLTKASLTKAAPTKAAPTEEAPADETSTAAKEPTEITKSIMDIVSEHAKAYSKQQEAMLKGKSSEEDKKN